MERVEPSMVKGGVIVPSAKKRSPKARQSYQLILGAVTRGYHLPRAIPKVKVFDENLRAEIGAAAFASSSNILPSDFNILAHPSRHRKKIPILHQEQATCTKIFNNEPCGQSKSCQKYLRLPFHEIESYMDKKLLIDPVPTK